jgi:LmbE family N-acetylglucosaminyl deacetylase
MCPLKVACIGAHPDDIELAMAGTVAKHSHRGDDVRMVVCTLGVRDPQDKTKLIREKETCQAAGMLGAKAHILDFPVLQLNKPSREFEIIMKRVIEDINPDRVYVHSPFDYHQIHESVSKVATKVTADIKQVFFYEVVSSSTCDFRPNAYVDITDFIDLKVRSIQAHLTQAKKIYIRSEVIRSLAHARYIMGKIGQNPRGLAEAFMIGRYVLDEMPVRKNIGGMVDVSSGLTAFTSGSFPKQMKASDEIERSSRTIGA